MHGYDAIEKAWNYRQWKLKVAFWSIAIAIMLGVAFGMMVR